MARPRALWYEAAFARKGLRLPASTEENDMSQRLILLIPAVAFAVAALPSCSKDPEFPEAPPPSASNTPPPPVTPVASGSTTPPPPPPANTVTACDAVQTTAFTTMITARQPTEAPKMEQVGSLVCGVAPEGQAASGQTFMLEQGYCYTVLGNALPGVTEVDLAMTVDMTGGMLPGPLAGIAPQVAVDNTTGTAAAIGGGKDCFPWTLVIPAAVKLTVKARTGSGPVGAQVYRRKK